MEQKIVYIDISKLHPHKDNPRKDVGDVTELAESIKANGILQNLTVVPDKGNLTGEPAGTYTVVIGHRRLAAAKLAGLKEVPCTVSDMTGIQQIRTMLTENMQRTDLSVYEQAQGFQMMLDLGDSVEQIAERAGFSETTVRRRVNMAKLDQGILKEVSDRQISLGDFDKLNQLDDMDERNKCLKEIGTNNFNSIFNSLLRNQNRTKSLFGIKAEIERLDAKAINSNDRYSSKYDRLCRVGIAEWDGNPLKPNNGEKPLFYYLDDNYGDLEFYVESERTKPEKRTQEEIDLEKRRAEAWAKAKEQAALAYKLRSDFVDKLTVTNKNIHLMLRGLLQIATLDNLTYVGGDPTLAREVLGIDDSYSADRHEKILTAFKALDEKSYPKLIYAYFGDSDGKDYFSGGEKYSFPAYDNNAMLNALYDWLTSLGYELSDEEKQMKDGTHPLLNLGDE